jgi:hypothetical protein
MHPRGPRLFHLGGLGGTFWLFLDSQCVPQDVLNSIPDLFDIHCPKFSSFQLIGGQRGCYPYSNRNF